MLYEMEGFRRALGRSYTHDDVTMVVAVRLHENNPWVVERILALGGYYEPAPTILIVDFGSKPGFREQVAEACARIDAKLLRVEDDGIFSLSKARNSGAAHSQTELLFFSDIDCFGDRDLFARLTAFANSIELGARFDQLVNLPVYHLGRESTETFFAAGTPVERSLALSRAMCNSVISAPGAVAEYVDPHSNFFLIRRDFYDYIGGGNETFRGHGSEDFEFLLRLSLYSLQFPVPDEPSQDLFPPRGADQYGARPYAGFRRLFELMALPAQLAGLRIAHLHHGRGRDDSGWYENNDWARTRFTDQIEPLLTSRIHLLSYDWMPRKQRALVLIKQESHADVFFPLRLAGFQIITANEADPDSMLKGAELIERGEIDAVAVFNPYMNSHRALKPLFDAARDKGIRTIVFERGTLPESWYYGPDMSYADPEFEDLELGEEEFSAAELELTDAYSEKLRSGQATLEANGDYTETMTRLEETCRVHDKVCLIPLQLPDDVAVTRFNEGFPSHVDFTQDLKNIAERHPEILFLIKTHPLNKQPLQVEGANVVSCDAQDNIHALIDLSHAVVCYNSGVGLLALIHQKRLVTVGNAFYNLKGLGDRASSLEDAVVKAFDPKSTAFHAKPVRVLLAWLLLRKYSFFRGESVVQEFASRKAHGYRNLLWYRLSLDGLHTSLRAGLDRRVEAKCYATAQLGIGHQLAARSQSGDTFRRPLRGGRLTRRLRRASKLSKLLRDPKRFLEDSRYGALRLLSIPIPETAGSQPAVRQLQKLVRDPVLFFEETSDPRFERISKRIARALTVL